MRELVIKKSCDECGAVTTRSFVAGIIASEVSPELRMIDLCDAHAAPFETVAAMLVNAAPFKSVHPKKPRGETECEICGRMFGSRKGTMDHVWQVHIGSARPPAPTVCPECGKKFEKPLAVGVHRSAAHGYDVLAEAYEIAGGMAKS